jgi:hypothetical protein
MLELLRNTPRHGRGAAESALKQIQIPASTSGNRISDAAVGYIFGRGPISSPDSGFFPALREVLSGIFARIRN